MSMTRQATMITITASNGTRGSGHSVAEACRDLVGMQRLAVKLGRGVFIPVEEASAAQLRASGAVWFSKDRHWRIGALVDDVAEGAQA